MIPQLQTEPIRPRTRLLVKRRRCPFLRGSAHPGWPDGQSSGSYGASVDRPEFVSAGLERLPLDPGGRPRSLLMVGQCDWRDFILSEPILDAAEFRSPLPLDPGV